MPRLTAHETARPQITRTAAEHLAAVMHAGSVPPVTKELCAVMVCGLNFCDSCLVARRAHARRHGVDAAKLTALWDYGRSELFNGAERAALAAAVALTREPRALPDIVWNELQAHYNDGEIVEILCAIGLFNYISRLNNALQLEIMR